jgi:hypothetical protein
MKTGTPVRLVQPEIRGKVKARRFDPSDELELLVEWTDPQGQLQQRWLKADQLEAVPVPPAEQPAEQPAEPAAEPAPAAQPDEVPQ